MRGVLIGLVIFLIILQYRLWFAKDGIVSVFHLKREIKVQEAKNREIIKQNNTMEDEIKALKNSKDAIENRARHDLGMVKKGEVFYQVVKA